MVNGCTHGEGEGQKLVPGRSDARGIEGLSISIHTIITCKPNVTPTVVTKRPCQCITTVETNANSILRLNVLPRFAQVNAYTDLMQEKRFCPVHFRLRMDSFLL